MLLVLEVARLLLLLYLRALRRVVLCTEQTTAGQYTVTQTHNLEDQSARARRVPEWLGWISAPGCSTGSFPPYTPPKPSSSERVEYPSPNEWVITSLHARDVTETNQTQERKKKHTAG
jgi:hypothetical protein